MKVSRKRIRRAKPLSSIVGSYAVVMVILMAFLVFLLLMVGLELLLFG